MRYDITKLKALKEYDIATGLRNYANDQDFFDALTEFTNLARGYLRMYNPTLVIYSDDIRADFLSELDKVGNIFNRLGVRLDCRELENISGAVATGNEKVLSDGLVKFFAKMEILSDNIKKTALTGDSVSQDVNPQINDNTSPVILAVDDMPQMLTTITGILENDFTVIAVTSGKTALKAIESHTPSLFLLDIEMPEMSGFELAGAIRKIERFEHTPILFLTAKRSRDYVLAAKALRIIDYILKPIDKAVLINKIQRVLGLV